MRPMTERVSGVRHATTRRLRAYRSFTANARSPAAQRWLGRGHAAHHIPGMRSEIHDAHCEVPEHRNP